MRIALFEVITQRVVVISYGRFGSTYRSHIQGSGIQNPFGLLTHLKMGPMGFPETSIKNYHYPLCNNPEERIYQLVRGGRPEITQSCCIYRCNVITSFWESRISKLKLLCLYICLMHSDLIIL